MEHSRLLKFLLAERNKNMSENPTINKQSDNETSNITAEVPGEQKIREIKDTDILTPVITVIKKETTLTKGDMKLQKITVTEDIARELENGGHRVYTEFQTTVVTDKQTDITPIMSDENTDTSTSESKSLEQRKSRIPKLKFKKTVERVKREIRKQKLNEQPHATPRRSSIPKLKDATLVKRPSSKQDWKPEESLKAEGLEEEFDKIYEEIVDKPQIYIDDKILAVKIDDPEKIETKFEEIIHSYDSNDDTYLTQTEKLRVSKIPGRKKHRTTQLGSLVEKVKANTPNNSLKDGGFKVSATTITTKRFSRGNSMDLNNQKVDVFEIDAQNGKNGDVINETIITETIEHIPATTEITYQTVSKETSLNEPLSMEIDEKVENSIHVSKTIVVDEDDSRISKEVTIRQTKSGIPVKPARINRGISKEFNKRPVSLDDRDFVNRKVVKHEELIDSNSQTIFKERVVTEKGVEKPPRGISRTFSRDGRSITVTTKAKESPSSKIPVAETAVKENNIASEIVQLNDKKPPKIDTKKESLLTEDVTKESVKVGIPVYTKITHSYSKGIIQNVEMSKTIEWKPAEIKIKRYGRSQSEYKPANGNILNKEESEIVTKDDSIIYEKSFKEPTPVITEISENIAMDTQVIETNNIEPANNSDEIIHIDTKVETDIYVENKPEISEDDISKPVDITEDTVPKIEDILQTYRDTNNKIEPIQDQDNIQSKEIIQKATILKGNVNRLISQISENGSKVVTKKEISGQDEMLKKKSVLSKIAMFEGKDPEELNIKVKKCTIDNKRKFEGTNSVNKIYKPYVTNDDTKSETNKIKSTKNFGNEPIIVDQIWKVREEDVQNVKKIEEIKIMPETVDITISENSDEVFETANTLPGSLGLDSQEIQPVLLDESIHITDNKLNELVEEPRSLPEHIEFDRKEKQTYMKITIPAKIDIISDNNKEDIVLYSPEQVLNTNQTTKQPTKPNNDDNQREIDKPKVGKLDINFWKKQVEVNKKNVGTGKSLGQKPTEINNVNMLIEKNINAKQVIEIPKSPKRIYTRQEVDIPTILPPRVDITTNTNVRPKILPDELESTNESQLQVPVTLPETPLMKPERNNYETQITHIEIPLILPAKIESIEDINSLQYANMSEENILHKATVAEVIPELNYHNYPKTPVNNIIEIDFNHETTTQEKENDIPINTGIVSAKIEVNELKANEVCLNTDYAEIDSKKDTTIFEKLPLEVENNELHEKEVPSDPELIDSETELKETKETIMRKLKNKIYFIANKNIKKTEDLTENIIYSENNKKCQPEENNLQYQHTKYDNDMYKSYDDVGNTDFEMKDDLKRAKSLAELDLGDVVKGQVQRMVYRIKSVDFDKMEIKSNKINAKEMPRKCSVLEKIALFEGKSNTNITPLRRRIEQRDVQINTTEINSSVTNNQTEEIFLKKVEDLSSAKLKYLKTQMLYIELNDGHRMPVITLGTALMDHRLTPHIVSCAIDLGYRSIDTAMIYGNEKALGEAIKMKIEDGSVNRQDLFIISKLWSTYHRPDLVETACRASLEALGLDYFDLYLIHNPMSFKEGKDHIPKIASVLQFSEYDYLDAWFAMEELVRKGLVKSIGVSNFNSKQLERILDRGRIKPVLNQVECHPYLSQERLQHFCAERNILIQCFGVLGATGTPIQYKAPGVTPVLDDPLVKVMASALDVSAGRLLVSYQLQSGRAVVVSTSSAAHLWDNLQAITFQMKPHELAALTALNKSERIYTYKGMGENHKNYPFREPF